MDDSTNRIIAIGVVHLCIWVLQQSSHRYLPELGKKHFFGIYLISLPVGFGLFRWDLPYWATAPMTAAGLYLLLAAFKKSRLADAPHLPHPPDRVNG